MLPLSYSFYLLHMIGLSLVTRTVPPSSILYFVFAVLVAPTEPQSKNILLVRLELNSKTSLMAKFKGAIDLIAH
jgi:hypothetical protein